MTDFRAAFNAGQDAAVRADLARKDIANVFLEVSNQLSEATEGKVKIIRKEFKKDLKWPAIDIFSSPEKFWAIAAYNPNAEDKNPRQLALWEQDRAGYPCKITWSNIDHSCHDRESLEECIASLLQDPIVGEKLRGVMMLPPPLQTGDAAQ